MSRGQQATYARKQLARGEVAYFEFGSVRSFIE